MATLRLIRCLAGAALLCSAAAAQPGMTVETLLQGLQKRQDHFATIAGRVVVGRKALSADKPGEQPSLTMVDFARQGAAFRIEQRELIVPTLRWTLAYDALNMPHRAAEPVQPRRLYASFICDGKTVWQYDRSTDRCFVAAVPASGRVYSPRTEGIDACVTVPFGDIVGRMREKAIRDGIMPAVVQARDTIEGHDCYRLYCDSGWQKGEGTSRSRTYYRVWIAPDLDFGAVRTEEVCVEEKLGLVHCTVGRARGWARAEGMDLWIPESYQLDSFHWTGIKEMQLPGVGWSRTLAVARLSLTNSPQAVAAALPLRHPFDCEIVPAEHPGDRLDDPTAWPNEVTPLLAYQPPDDFGMKLTPETNLEALFQGR